MLNLHMVSARYGEAAVLHQTSLHVQEGEVVTLIGRNGAGKTTLLRCVMGLHADADGQITFDGRDITRLPVHDRVRHGLGYVPDDRGMYSSLTVAEHLLLPRTVSPAAWSVERVYESFPVLGDRRRSLGTQLSGGEQQMLSIARVLRMGAKMLLCDEPTEGLSPRLVDQIGDILREVKAQGVPVLLVEQNVHFATSVADRHYVLAQGRVVQSLENSEVEARESELLEYLGI